VKYYTKNDLKHHPSTPVMVKLNPVKVELGRGQSNKPTLGCKHNMERWIEWEFTGEPEGSDFDNYPYLTDKVAAFGDNMRMVCPRGCEDIHIRIGMDRKGL